MFCQINSMPRVKCILGYSVKTNYTYTCLQKILTFSKLWYATMKSEYDKA